MLEIEIWSDVVCPWCYIGKRRFESALAEFQAAYPEMSIRVRYRAFQLDPGAPVGESQRVFDVYEKKFGGPQKAREIISRMVREGEGVGITFRFDLAQRSNTLWAHQLLVLAEKAGVQGPLKERLLGAYFCDGKAIGDKSTLVQLGQEVGIEEGKGTAWLESAEGLPEVKGQLQTAVELGITSVPTFVFNRSLGITGAQAPEVFVRTMERATRGS